METKHDYPILQYFTYSHLPLSLQAVSSRFSELAHYLVAQLPPGPELSAGLRKLLEAKDCAVRQALSPEATQPKREGGLLRPLSFFEETRGVGDMFALSEWLTPPGDRSWCGEVLQVLAVSIPHIHAKILSGDSTGDSVTLDLNQVRLIPVAKSLEDLIRVKQREQQTAEQGKEG